VRAPRRTPWQLADWCVLDVETTGLDHRLDQVISVAAVPVRAGRILAGEMFTTLVHSDRAPSAQSVRVHGIRTVDLVDAPAPADVAESLAPLVRGAELVAHYAPVERAFLLPLIARSGIRPPRRMADTEALGRLWLYERDGVMPGDLALGRLAAELGLPSHHPHDALGDALTTAQVFIALAALLSASSPQSVGDLLRGATRAANIAAVAGRDWPGLGPAAPI
jgi:DNA polymerase-3 subunit epsilon